MALRQLILLLIFAFAAEAEERRLLPVGEQAAWNAVGRLNFGDGFCSAALIAPDLVATSAHCLYARRTGRERPFGRFHFVAGYRQGRYAGLSQAAGVAAHPAYVFAPKAAFSEAGVDLALIRLKTPIEGVKPLPIGAAPVGGETVAVVSYGRDRAEIASIAPGCLVRGARNGAVALKCDVTFGVSGAPVLRITPKGPELVAIISAMGGGGRAAAASAAGLTDVRAP